MERKRVGVFFGGVSPEHEVSVISGHQVIAAMDRDLFEPVPVYIAKDGTWLTGGATGNLKAYSDLDTLRKSAVEIVFGPASHGRMVLVDRDAGRRRWRRPPEAVQIDVVFPAFHGGAGESGGFQGLCEMLNVACVGSGVLGSALGMDKLLSKRLSALGGIPVVPYVGLSEADWADSEDAWLTRIDAEIGLPVVVKPARLGSSIGIQGARDRESLGAAVEGAFRYDNRVVVEKAIEDLREINCSVLGSSRSIRLSVLEEPVRSSVGDLLSFADKYQRGAGSSGKAGAAATKVEGGRGEGMASLDRIIPAKLSAGMEAEIRALAERVFRVHDCSGVVRIDFLIDATAGRVYFNEVNTIPGSFSFYLWEPAGVTFTELVTSLIEIAFVRHRDVNARVRSYDVNLLSPEAVEGLAGAKRPS